MFLNNTYTIRRVDDDDNNDKKFLFYDEDKYIATKIEMELDDYI